MFGIINMLKNYGVETIISKKEVIDVVYINVHVSRLHSKFLCLYS